MGKPDPGEGWKAFTKRRFDELKKVEVPQRWVKLRMLLSLMGAEYRLHAQPPRAGEKPKNPGRMRRMKQKVLQSMKDGKKKRKELAKESTKKRLEGLFVRLNE